jgi:glutamyl-Q tRNA(Asp) synthetase
MTAGRFAPSPTGPLHLGSLLAATASFLDARARGYRWRLRIDDLDVHRNQPGAEAEILHALEAHDLIWDGPVQRQSERLPVYENALQQLTDQSFYCNCSRRLLAGQSIYPGTCRDHRQPRSDCAVRIRVNEQPISFDDGVMGPQTVRLSDTLGDFIIRRRDGLIAYQLATAVDDGDDDISHVVRGRDLLDNTARQIFLIDALGLSVPAYAHVPTLIHANGQKLSKQHGAQPIESRHASKNISTVLAALGFLVTPEMREATCSSLLDWATAQWRLEKIPRRDIVVET